MSRPKIKFIKLKTSGKNALSETDKKTRQRFLMINFCKYVYQKENVHILRQINLSFSFSSFENN